MAVSRLLLCPVSALQMEAHKSCKKVEASSRRRGEANTVQKEKK